jgi:ribosome-associated protein
MVSFNGPDQRDFSEEFVFSATRSSGPGGQHVNKVSTRIELRFDVRGSKLLCDEEKEIILDKLANRISKDGILILVSQTERSQYDNKLKAIEKFYLLIRKALTPVKKRKKTMPTSGSRLKRLEGKQLLSEKKARRKQIPEE